jgi:hypothetical protein
MIRLVRPLDASQRREAKQLIALAKRLVRRRMAAMMVDGVRGPVVARNMLRNALYNLELQNRMLDELWHAVDRADFTLEHEVSR